MSFCWLVGSGPSFLGLFLVFLAGHGRCGEGLLRVGVRKGVWCGVIR